MHRLATSVFLLPVALTAQSPFQGNGVPSAYIEHSLGVLGQQLDVGFGSPTMALPIALLALSDGVGPFISPDPIIGTIGLDLLSSAFQLLSFTPDASGHVSASLLLPPGYPLPGDPPLFLLCATLEAGGLSTSKTVRVDWANPDGWEVAGSLAQARQMHTATPLGLGPRDNVTQVLVCGGATGSFVVPLPMADAEVYSPLHRTAALLPPMSLPRAGHRALRLPDGRVLVCGGVTTGGLVTATCEFFDPQLSAFAPAPSMNAPRASHAMTLLGDGRVLVSGGVADWQNTATAFIAALNTAQDTAELFDPVAGTWSALPNMASKRVGHSQTRLPDGRVLVTSGIRGGYAGTFGGGQVPQYTDSCEILDPLTLLWTPAGDLTHSYVQAPFGVTHTLHGRAFHGASLLPDGNVLLTGGIVAQIATLLANDESIPVAACHVFDVASNAWVATAPLPVAAAFHCQVQHDTGALVSGGFTVPLATLAATAQTVFHDGVAVTALADLGTDAGSGTPQPRGAHTLTALHDGSFLVYGGGLWPGTLSDGWVYTPQ